MFSGLVITLDLTGISLSITRGGLMKFVSRLQACHKPECSDERTSSPCISGGPA